MTLAVGAIALACAALYLYLEFSTRIENRMREGLQQYTAQVYARPYSIIPGRPLTEAELAERLARLGYSQADPLSPGAFRRAGGGLELANRRGQRVQVTFSGDEVAGVLLERQPVARFDLEPELISNLSDPSGRKRRYVPYAELPDRVIQAILSAEDKRFFDHPGIDFWRILKAAIVDIQNNSLDQGASTLTQQYVKNLFLTPEKSIWRKLQEVCLALILEKRLSKQQIFELYANEIYLGQQGPHGITGFGQAAALFFHKHIRDLSLSEAAFLAGIIPAPNRFNPYRYPERARQQRNRVLDLMEENGFINLQQKIAAKAELLTFQPTATYNYVQAPYFVDYVEHSLASRFSPEELYKRNYRIYTTLDADLQRAAFEAVGDGAAEIDRILASRKIRGTPQAALIALDPATGEILAMVGGRNFGQSQYNRTVAARRQPGSAFKPFVYAAALERTFGTAPNKTTPASLYPDEPYTFRFGNRLYAPKNFGDKYLGRANLRQALMHSLNVATVHVAEEAGYGEIVSLAKRAGFSNSLKPYPSVALGAFEVTPLELAQAYTIFANQGRLSAVRAVTAVQTDSGTYRQAQPSSRDVIHPQTAYLVTSMMESVLDEGTGAGARRRGFDLPAAGKTGTSNDGWFVGFTPDLLCLVWVGFDDNRDINLVGAGSALPIWTGFMKRAERQVPLLGANFARPGNIVTVSIDPSTGLLASPRCLRVVSENFIAGTEPTAHCPEGKAETRIRAAQR